MSSWELDRSMLLLDRRELGLLRGHRPPQRLRLRHDGRPPTPQQLRRRTHVVAHEVAHVVLGTVYPGYRAVCLSEKSRFNRGNLQAKSLLLY